MNKKLFSIARFSALATALTGAAKLLLLIALVVFQVPATTRLFAQSFADDGKSARSGDKLTYRVTLSNAGSGSASNLTFTDSIPTGTTFVSGSTKINGVASGNAPTSGVLTIPFASLAAAETKTIEFAATIAATSGVVSNNASVSYAESTTVVSSNTVSNSVAAAPAPTPVCGNGTCESGETATSCVADCAPTPPACECTAWVSGSCAAGGCSTTQRSQTRTCTPSGCKAQTQCVADSACAPPPPPEKEPVPQPEPVQPSPPTPLPEGEGAPAAVGAGGMHDLFGAPRRYGPHPILAVGRAAKRTARHRIKQRMLGRLGLHRAVLKSRGLTSSIHRGIRE